jgi:hypothetical protein
MSGISTNNKHEKELPPMQTNSPLLPRRMQIQSPLLHLTLLVFLLLLHLPHSSLRGKGSQRSQLSSNSLIPPTSCLLQRLAYRTTMYQLCKLTLNCLFLITTYLDASRMVHAGRGVGFFAEALDVLVGCAAEVAPFVSATAFSIYDQQTLITHLIEMIEGELTSHMITTLRTTDPVLTIRTYLRMLLCKQLRSSLSFL